MYFATNPSKRPTTLAALGRLGRLWLNACGRRNERRYRRGALIDGGEYLPTMPERYAQLLEVFVR
jgi:hypothetical protein